MRCVIVGAGGHGRVVLDILQRSNAHQVIGFVDSDASLIGRRVDGKPVFGTLDCLSQLRETHGVNAAIVAIGDNGVRREFADHIASMGLVLINAIHPSANLAQSVSLGRNIVIAAGSLVCAHCHIGDSVILNTGCIVDHESMIAPASHVCPGARIAGRVSIQAGAFIGIGATIIQSVCIGHHAVVGAGAVVIQDVAACTTVVGVPAHRVKRDKPIDQGVRQPFLPPSKAADVVAPLQGAIGTHD